MSQSSVTSQSTWRSKIKAMGPGILMASAAVGGSHIVSSISLNIHFSVLVRNTQQILGKL